MTRVFFITERDDLARSVSRFLRYREGIAVRSTIPPATPRESTRGEEVQWVPQTFRKLAAWIEEGAAAGGSLFNAIVIIDVPSLVSLEQLDPIDRTKDWTAVVAMLLLAYPEVHWVLFSPGEFDAGRLLGKAHSLRAASFFDDLEEVLLLHDNGYSPLFDPAGLRDRIRQNLRTRPDACYVPTRGRAAAAIDEEEHYSYFNAYTAYRFGYRSHVITSYEMMLGALEQADDAADLDLTFEDVYLNFPDKRLSLSKIAERDNEFEVLRGVKMRVFVTGGHELTAAEQDTWDLNRMHLRELRERGCFSTVLYKPGSGVFNIWSRSGVRGKLWASGGKAPDFLWPPPLAAVQSNISGTHSAPGRLLLVADQMIRRARRAIRDAHSIADAVLVATLAVDAEEYLGHRTPTTSLEAVSLKHQAEVLAECMFYGVEYHLDTRSRFEEIERAVDSIGVWFRSRTREVSKLNAEIGLLSELILKFRGFNQFNEEQAALTKVRHLHRRLWLRRNKTWAWIFYPARWYFDQLLGSMTVFIATLSAWLIVFGLVFSQLRDHTNAKAEDPYMHGLEDAITAFFGMQPPHDLMTLQTTAGEATVWVSMLIIVLSFVHLGIFVSHLYSIIARR